MPETEHRANWRRQRYSNRTEDKKEEQRAKRREWYGKNKDTINSNNRDRYLKDPTWYEKYREANKEIKATKAKIRNITNIEFRKSQRAVWRETLRGFFCIRLAIIKRRNKGHDIGYVYLESLYEAQKGRCALTGRVMLTDRSQSLDSLSIDRINPKLGYLMGNVRLVTWQSNSARHIGTDEELLSFCKDVIKHSRSLRP